MIQEVLYAPYQEELVCLYKKSIGGATYPYHRHDGYEVFLFLDGNVQFYLEENCYEVKPGDMFIMSPNNMHRVISKDKNSYERITINMRKEVIQRLSTEQTDLFTCFAACDEKCVTPVTISKEKRRRFVEYVNHLSNSMKSHAYGADIRSQMYLTELLLMVNECFQKEDNNHPSIMPELVRDLIVYIRANCNEEITLDKLSQTFYHNGTYISRIFKKYTGLTLRNYILDTRIENAKRCLENGTSVSDACYASGFSDYANFIRSFKKITGVSPGKWTKRVE